ncbi:MAG TPA: hypothetical protein VLR54_02370 [Methanobacteriaceae archaeon]|jgi:hypothetical protein|nr:hypothetical protein [Methanobacteriaceae archaeon]
MKPANEKVSIFGRTRNFLSRVSDGYVLHSSSVNRPFSEQIEEIENLGLSKPDVTKALIDKALKDTSLSKIKVDINSQEFRDEVNKRTFVKNVKQKVAFAVGAIPMFKTLQDISIVTALDPRAQIPLSLPLYFGISMPAFVALHIVEHTLPIGLPRYAVKCTKVLTGIPFCVTSEIVDKVSSEILKTLRLPDAALNMQGTIGVPSDIKVQDVVKDMKRWGMDAELMLELLKQNQFISK